MHEQILNNEQLRRERFYGEVKKTLGTIFDKLEPDERKEKIKKELQDFIVLLPEAEREFFVQHLENLDLPKQRDEFIETVFNNLKPIIDLKFKSPLEFEEIQRERFDVQHPEFIKVNQLFYIEFRKDSLHLHVPPNETLLEKLSLLKDAFHKIAVMIGEHPEIQQVQGETWIFSKERGGNPGLAEKLGFTIIDKEKGLAYISREDFVRKYS